MRLLEDGVHIQAVQMWVREEKCGRVRVEVEKSYTNDQLGELKKGKTTETYDCFVSMARQ